MAKYTVITIINSIEFSERTSSNTLKELLNSIKDSVDKIVLR